MRFGRTAVILSNMLRTQNDFKKWRKLSGHLAFNHEKYTLPKLRWNLSTAEFIYETLQRNKVNPRVTDY